LLEADSGNEVFTMKFLACSYRFYDRYDLRMMLVMVA